MSAFDTIEIDPKKIGALMESVVTGLGLLWAPKGGLRCVREREIFLRDGGAHDVAAVVVNLTQGLAQTRRVLRDEAVASSLACYRGLLATVLAASDLSPATRARIERVSAHLSSENWDDVAALERIYRESVEAHRFMVERERARISAEASRQ